MRPARTRSDPPSLADLVHRAGEVVDPEGSNDGVWDFADRFADSDEPVGAEPAFVEEQIAETKGAIDPQDEDAQVTLAAAVATYLGGHGVAKARIASKGLGETAPLYSPEASETEKAANRRVEVRLLPYTG